MTSLSSKRCASAAHHRGPWTALTLRVLWAQIQARLQPILLATGWFSDPNVRVNEGVVFLGGTTTEDRYHTWAAALARRTEGVVAVVNEIEVTRAKLTDLSPALDGLEALLRGVTRAMPFAIVGLLLLVISFYAGRIATWLFRKSMRRRNQPDLVRELSARGVGLLVFTLGLYLALRVAGLTRLAATVLGGTGILGLVIGIAFRDMAENLLASLLLTRHQPFRRGDLVEIEGIEGYVQRLTVRATILMSLDGNHIQIPNSTVYKSAIRNYTSNPLRRIDFVVGIGYGDPIAHAQQMALEVLAQHPAVLREPEPWVLAESLGSAVVNLRVYVWLDGSKHSWLKVRSSVVRLVKRAFQEANISMPDEAREIVFPEGVPVRMLEHSPNDPAPSPLAGPPSATGREETTDISTSGEARLESDNATIQQLAQESRAPEGGMTSCTLTPPQARALVHEALLAPSGEALMVSRAEGTAGASLGAAAF